jgi:hypothetical protein
MGHTGMDQDYYEVYKGLINFASLDFLEAGLMMTKLQPYFFLSMPL